MKRSCCNRKLLSFLLVVFIVAYTLSFQLKDTRSIWKPHRVTTLNISKKDADKEEQWRIQQDMLARRKDKTKMKKYFEGVEETRKSVADKYKETIWTKGNNDKDPLEQWKAAKDAGKLSVGCKQ